MSTRISDVRPAGDAHRVITVHGGKGSYRREPCETCPWRTDCIGEFPAEAFKHSAHVAYDMAEHTFGCHSSGVEKPAICAGFLLRNADHNLRVRLQQVKGMLDMDAVQDGGYELFDSYRAMAVGNGVDAADPVLQRCRANDEYR